MGRRSLPLPLWVVLVCGLIDGLLGLVSRPVVEWVPHDALGIVPVMAGWILGGVLVWAAYALVGALCLPYDGRRVLRAQIAGALPRLWRTRREQESRRGSATTLAALSAVGAYATTSVLVGAYLIDNRHGSTLIAIAILGAQLGAAAACVVAYLVLKRMLIATFDAIARRLPLLVSAPAVLGTLLGGLTVFASLAAKRYWDTVVAVETGAIALAAVALLGLVMADALTTRPLHTRALAIVIVGASAALWLGLLIPAARSLAMGRTLVAKYLIAELRDGSDFDKDGSPWFPGGEDCAPFDPARHPFVLEKPHNGIDDNCDGSDTLSMEFVKPLRRAKPTRKIAPKPNLVLITLDATRADHMGFLGYKRHNTTPNLNALAARSTVFTSAFSQDSGTGPSTWSLMTGRTPFQVRFSSAARFPYTMAASEKLLAELLQKAGYQTSATLCGGMFSKAHWNIRRGFTEYAEVCGKLINEVADLTADAAIASLQKLKPDAPFFVWVHLLDPHFPYSDHADLRFGRAAIDRYDEEIHAADSAVGRILKALKALPSDRPTYIAVTADHGENFNEHGSAQHARNLYREVTQVPLIIAGPDLTARKVTTPVASSDLYPTFLDLAGVEVPAESTMASQFNVLFGAAPDASRLVFQENSFSRPVRHVKAAVSDQMHLLFDTSNQVIEVYDWRRDPGERINLYGEGGAEERRLRQAMLVFLTTTKLPPELTK